MEVPVIENKTENRLLSALESILQLQSTYSAQMVLLLSPVNYRWDLHGFN